ncbi:unnamed protein product [Trichobilharzia regenti]|nr:unnamed protein product [Trichobilharzia regenti]
MDHFPSASNLPNGDPVLRHHFVSLLCVPINPPSGNGIVDYRFRTNPHTSHTFAYAEIFCPSDRWLEPTDPGLDDVYSGIIHTSITTNNNDNNPWWLERRRHVTLICDHHERKWTPNRLPEACLTCELIDYHNIYKSLSQIPVYYILLVLPLTILDYIVMIHVSNLLYIFL